MMQDLYKAIAELEKKLQARKKSGPIYVAYICYMIPRQDGNSKVTLRGKYV